MLQSIYRHRNAKEQWETGRVKMMWDEWYRLHALMEVLTNMLHIHCHMAGNILDAEIR